MSIVRVDRRAFLTLAGVAVASGALAGCSNQAPTPPTTTTTLGPPNQAAWNALGDSLSGTLVLPANPLYANAAEVYNLVYAPSSAPAAIAYAASASDVAKCLAFAIAHGIDFTARCGGHSYAGYSTTSGLIIDVTAQRAISVNASAQTATVGAGARLIDVYNQVGSAGFLLPGGSCPSVGIAGLAQGGGIGVFGRAYGMTCDNVVGFTIVCADGSIRTCSASENPDLFWACRGGGGGNFGVITEFTFSVHPMPPVTLFYYQWDFSAATSVLSAWQDWISTLPPELWSNCFVLSNQGTLTLGVGGCSTGPSSQVAGLLGSLVRSSGAQPNYKHIYSEPYLQAMQIEGNCPTLTVAACHLNYATPAGVLTQTGSLAKSNYLATTMSQTRLAATAATVAQVATEFPTLAGGIAFDGYGGVINQVASDFNAFVHRDAIACMQASVTFTSPQPKSELTQIASWLNLVQSEVFDLSAGAYQNYIDPTLPNWLEAYYGSNLSRLVSIKAAVDPDNRFVFAQSIPTSMPQGAS